LKAYRTIRGFSLIELIVGVAILAILASVALPAFKTMLLNARVRNAAQSVMAGLTKAKNESSTRGPAALVQFTLTDTTDASWTVVQLPTVINGAVIPIDASTGKNEGSKNINVVLTGGNIITYNAFNGVVAGGITRIDLSVTDGTKPLRITFKAASGTPTMCESLLPLNSGPRACPY